MSSKMKCVGLRVLLMSLPMLAFAASGPGSLGGSYSIKNVVQQGANVKVTFNFRLVNYTNAEIKKVTIMLSDHLPPAPQRPPAAGVRPAAGMAAPMIGNNHGTVQATFDVHRKLEVKNATFSVPAMEYAQWQRGTLPLFMVSYPAANGTAMFMPIRLVREP